MDSWTALLSHAQAEVELAFEGRWDELAASTAERTRIAATLGPAPAGARLTLQALAVVQQQLQSMLEAARADTVRELGALRSGARAASGYAASAAVPQRRWVNDRA